MYTKEDIFAQLRALRAPQDRIVMLHTSLRLVGEVQGGGEGLLDALITHFTAKGGLLCVAAHTWNNLGKYDRYTLDLQKKESNLGTMASIAMARADGIRSENPSHSVVVFGARDRASAFIEEEKNILTPTAPEGCHGKLYTERGAVLLLGVSQSKNTFIHAADEILGTAGRMMETPYDVTVRRENGEVVQRKLTLYEEAAYDISERFPKLETAFRYHRCLTDGFIGDAPAQLCDAHGMLETMRLIYSRCGERDPLGDERSIPPKWYAK
jgi:aminoglycoside 3-N-acetyltransferase